MIKMNIESISCLINTYQINNTLSTSKTAIKKRVQAVNKIKSVDNERNTNQQNNQKYY